MTNIALYAITKHQNKRHKYSKQKPKQNPPKIVGTFIKTNFGLHSKNLLT